MSLLGLIVSDIPHASLLFSTPTICVYYIISLTPNDPHVLAQVLSGGCCSAGAARGNTWRQCTSGAAAVGR